jgi:hypothetical protein
MGAMTTPLRLQSSSTATELARPLDEPPYAVQQCRTPSLVRGEPAEGACLRIAAGAEWFQLGDQHRVVLETRIPLRRLLLALARMKASSPTSVLPVTAAFAAGWPGERATPTAAAMRVYTAVHSLRRLGLRGVLVRRRRGYVLDCDVEIAANESQLGPAMLAKELTALPA